MPFYSIAPAIGQFCNYDNDDDNLFLDMAVLKIRKTALLQLVNQVVIVQSTRYSWNDIWIENPLSLDIVNVIINKAFQNHNNVDQL